MPPRTAIVTTLRDAEDVLASFVQYHLGMGFDHLFLFFDDPDAEIPKYIRHHPNISVFGNDNALSHAWETTSLFTTPAIARSINHEVMTRQLLNAEIALRKAFYQGIDWLLHIDIDELFYSKLPLAHHFSQLIDQGVDCAIYTNFEAVPELHTINDFFKEVTLFKINPSNKAQPIHNKQQQKLLAKIPQIPASFFHYYVNGKAAVRVTEQTVPKGVHNFSIPHNGFRKVMIDDPIILHYPCCGLKHFTQKYRTRDMYREQWFGKPGGNTGSNAGHDAVKMPAYFEGRDVVNEGGEDKIRMYYINNFVLSDPKYIRSLLASKLSTRIEYPANYLNQHYKSRGVLDGAAPD